MKIVCNVLAFVVLACLNLSAQQITRNIRGTVTDLSGAAIQGSAGYSTAGGNGLSRSTTTDRNGNYVVLELPVGHYRLQVAAKGFQEYVQDGITLNVNETASVSPYLTVGSERTRVLMSADAKLIEPTVISMGKVLQQRELEDLPLDAAVGAAKITHHNGSKNW
jgi:Carboxypeptidase regulatory-like domain